MKKILSFFLAACLPAVALAQWPGQGLTVRATNGFSRFQTLLDPTNNGIATFSGTISATSAFNANQFDTTGVIDLKIGSLLTNHVEWGPTNNWVTYFTNNPAAGYGSIATYISTNRVGGIASFYLDFGTFDGAGNLSSQGANAQIGIQYDHNGLSSGAITDVRNTEFKIISGGSIALVTGNGNNGKDRVQVGTTSGATTGTGSWMTFMRQITANASMMLGYSAVLNWDASYFSNNAAITVTPGMYAKATGTNGTFELQILPDFDGPGNTGAWTTNAVPDFRFVMGGTTNATFVTSNLVVVGNSYAGFSQPAAANLAGATNFGARASMIKTDTDVYNFITIAPITNYAMFSLRGFTGNLEQGTLTNTVEGYYKFSVNVEIEDTLQGSHTLGVYTNNVLMGMTSVLIGGANANIAPCILGEVFFIPAGTRCELKETTAAPAIARNMLRASFNIDAW